MDNDLKTLNDEGFLVGPKETEFLFFSRVSYLKKGSFPQKTLSLPTLSLPSQGIKIDWAKGFLGKKSLFTWEPACTWIYEEKQFLFPLIQIRKNHQQNKELLKHEYIHAARSAFEEPIFEEFLAYSVHTNWYRRILGPLFTSSKESLLVGVFPLLFPFLSIHTLLFSITCFFYLSFLLFLFLRLIKRHMILKSCLQQLSIICANPTDSKKILIRLTDFEIKFFSKKTVSEMIFYIKNQKSFRWKQLLASYLIKGINA